MGIDNPAPHMRVSAAHLARAHELILAFLKGNSTDPAVITQRFVDCCTALRSAREVMERESISALTRGTAKTAMRAYWRAEDDFEHGDPLIRTLRAARNGGVHGVDAVLRFTHASVRIIDGVARLDGAGPTTINSRGIGTIRNAGTPDEIAEYHPMTGRTGIGTQIISDVGVHAAELLADTTPEGALKMGHVYFRDLWYAAAEDPPREIWHEQGDIETF